MIELIPSAIVDFAIKHASEKDGNEIIKNIDFGDIKKSLKLIMNYQGLKILEIKNKKGEEITIIT